MFRERKAKNKPKPQRNRVINEEPSNCIICLDTVSCRGRLGVCNHWFCFHCIFEWSKNTNTCPICKARFRCITKVHLNTLKSPPKKVRVRDRDQRVWNDDDDIAAGQVDLSEDPSSDDLDDNYEPSIHVTDPWTSQDNYNRDDSFINNDDDELILAEDHGGNETSDTEECVLPRESPYLLRRSGRPAAMNVSLTDSILELVNEDGPNIGGASPASMGSFIVSDDDLSDFKYEQWIPRCERTQNSRNRSEHQKAVKEKTTGMRTRATKPVRKVPKSQTTVKNQVSTRSKRKAADAPGEALSSGWINMDARREKMRTLRSSRIVPRRRCSRMTNQRAAMQVSSDSEQINDTIPSSRPKRTGNSGPQCSSSTALHHNRKTSKALTTEESDDSDHCMPVSFKGKGKSKCLNGKEPSLNLLCSIRLTREALILADESDSDDMSMPSIYRSRAKAWQPNKGKEVTSIGNSNGYQDSHESASYNMSPSNRIKRRSKHTSDSDDMSMPSSSSLPNKGKEVTSIGNSNGYQDSHESASYNMSLSNRIKRSKCKHTSDSDDTSMPSSSRSRAKAWQPNKGKEVTSIGNSNGYQDSHESASYNKIMSLSNRMKRSKHTSDSDDMSMPSSSRSRAKAWQPNKGKEVTNQDSRESAAYNLSRSNRIKGRSKNTGSTAKSSMSVGIKNWNKENQCSTASYPKEKRQSDICSTATCTRTIDESCIAPTPQPHRYHSVFFKRSHRSPTCTFEDSEDSDTKGCTDSQLTRKTNTSKVGRGVTREKSCKRAGVPNDVLCWGNVQTCLQKGDSPLPDRKCKKRIRLLASDSESD